MKNNFELYDSIKAMINAPKAKAEPLAGLSETTLAAYAKKGPNSPISGQYQATPTIAESVVVEAETIERDKHGNVVSREGDRDREVKADKGKWKSKSYKTADGKWASKDIKEEAEVELSEEELQAIADNITEEEFEQLDELSKEKLGQYIKKAHHSGTKHAVGMEKSEPVAGGKWDMHYDKVKNRRDGIDRAVKKLVKEDVEVTFSEEEIAALESVEQLDEVSKETLKSYIGKNHLDPSRIKKRGPTPKDKAARLAKRDVGHVMASSKLAKIHKKEVDNELAKHADTMHQASNHFMSSAHDHLTKKGYTFHGEHKHEGAVYSKYHPHNGVMNTYKVKRSVGFTNSPSISHTSIQGHSYSGNSAHHYHHGLGNEIQHRDIANGVHEYIDSTEHSSHKDAENDHHWKEKETNK